MVTPNGTNGINGFGGFDDERETLLHTALFKQVSSEEARELLPYLLHAEYDKGDSSSARETPTIACICWRKAASN